MTPLIFLVDDDADFLDLGRRILEARGYAVECFAHPAQALEAIRRSRPALLVSDVMMDALDSGFSLAKSIKADPALHGIPVIIVTAASRQRGFDFQPRTAEDLKAMNADAFFSKPVSPEALVSKVQELLG